MVARPDLIPPCFQASTKHLWWVLAILRFRLSFFLNYSRVFWLTFFQTIFDPKKSNPKRLWRGNWWHKGHHSGNDGISGEDYSLHYMKVDDITAGVMRRRRGSLMAKFDVQNAYRTVPTHSDDRQFLGMKWLEAFYVDMVLSFGVRSAPYIFTCIADLLEWVAKQNYNVTFLMHYLDEFNTIGPPSSSNLDRSIDCFAKLGIPLHPDKL